MYTPSIPGYRIGRLNGAIDLARCARDRVPCQWCGQLLERHVFDTYCPPGDTQAGPAISR